jgi:hypothetical protein
MDLLDTGSNLSWWSRVSLGTYSKIKYNDRTRLKVEDIEGDMCWGCFRNFPKTRMRPCLIEKGDVESIGLGQLCGLPCLKRFLKERPMDTSLKNRILFWSVSSGLFEDDKSDGGGDLGCDWRLHEDFGGGFNDYNVPLIAFDVQYPIVVTMDDTNTPPLPHPKINVMWKTTHIPQTSHNPQDVDWAFFIKWVQCMPTEMNIRVSGGAQNIALMPEIISGKTDGDVVDNDGDEEDDDDDDKKDDDEERVVELLKNLPPDDPISVWHKRNQGDPKSKKYVLFRPKPFPFKISEQCLQQPTTCMQTDEDDEI